MDATAGELPGGIGMSRLDVYPWPAADGVGGGSPHLHLACTECYLVLAGTGEVHTLTVEGPRRTVVGPGDAVWFTPGTIHRAVNTGGLRVQVLMQNAGLPEAGDAVLTFPREYLTDPDAYAAAAYLGGGDARSRERRARERRDLAVTGYRELLRRHESGDGTALARFHADAAALVRPRLDAWERAWRATALAAAQRTGEQLAALRAGDHSHLAAATVTHLPAPPADTHGMCGHLSPYVYHNSFSYD